MTDRPARPVVIPLDDGERVSGLLLAPPSPRAAYVLAHGAGKAGKFQRRLALDVQRHQKGEIERLVSRLAGDKCVPAQELGDEHGVARIA